MAEVRWNLFRGRLKRAIDDENLSPRRIEVLTDGAVSPAVLNLFLSGERDDLPAEYLSLLCGLKDLGLRRDDYAEAPPPSPKRDQRTPAQRAANERVATVWGKQLTNASHIATIPYVILRCRDPQAMKDAFRDCLSRAGVSQIVLGRRFNLTARPRASHVEMSNFFGVNDSMHGGPVFGHKLQEQFWDICAFLNEEIQRREPTNAPLTTEQFLVEMLRKGTILHPNDTAASLKKLSDFVSRGSPSSNANR